MHAAVGAMVGEMGVRGEVVVFAVLQDKEPVGLQQGAGGKWLSRLRIDAEDEVG